MRSLGIFIVVLSLIVPIPWFWELAAKHDVSAVFSQYLGSAALILMGISQLLATRWWGLEKIFGGLDRIYVLHKWLGISALLAVLVHDTIDAEMDGLGVETLLSDIAETLGEISLYGFLILVVLSIATFVPYHLWKYTHKLMGGFFAASAFHYAFILKPFALMDPAGLYVLSFCVLGIVCYLYTLVPFGTFQARHLYQVTNATVVDDAVHLTLKAKGQGISHKPGQFAFVRFNINGLEEPHPFTISSAPANGEICFTIKRLGDFTSRLIDTIETGVEVNVSGGFGHFQRKSHAGSEIWIAGGIGITPFVAFAQSMGTASNQVHLYHCVKNADRAPHKKELEKIAKERPELTYHLIDSSRRSRLTVDEIVRELSPDFDQLQVYFCGPEAQREAMFKGFKNHGLKAASFHFEEFDMRKGIGLRKLARWGMHKIQTRFAPRQLNKDA